MQNSILDKRFSFESSDNISSAITEIHHQQFRLCWAANCRLFKSTKKIVSISILWRIDFAIYAFNYSIKLGTVNFACMQSYWAAMMILVTQFFPSITKRLRFFLSLRGDYRGWLMARVNNYIVTETLPGRRDKSRPTDSSDKSCGRLSCPHCFRRPDTALPFRSFYWTYSLKHMYCVSSSTCWEHLREYPSCVRNRLDCRRIVVWWQSARRRSASLR